MKKQNSFQTNRLWRFRHARGLILKQVAAMLGHISTSKVSSYENGITDPSLKNVIKLALIYDSDIRDMFPDMVETCRTEIEATIKQRLFVFAWPEKMKVLECINHCTFEEKLKSKLSEEDKDLAVKHLRTFSNKFHHLN